MRHRRGTGTVAGVALLLILAPTASAAKPLVESLTVAPAGVTPGSSAQASVSVRNAGSDASKTRRLLLKMRRPEGPPADLVARIKIGPLRAGQSRNLDIAVPVDAADNPGPRTVVACREKAKKRSKCIRARQQTALTVLAPSALEITPAAHDFGGHATGTTSATRTFTVRNAGEAPTGPIATSVAGQFSKSGDTCNGESLGAGESCTLSTAFEPTTLGAKSASLSATASPGGSSSAALQGTGLKPAELTATPPSSSFGGILVDQTGTQTVVLENVGEVPTGNLSVAVTAGGDHDFFEILSGPGTTCSGSPLGPGATCTLEIRFSPTSGGAGGARAYSSSIFSDTDPGTPTGDLIVPLTGTGLAPAHLEINPTSFDFGPVALGDQSAEKAFDVTNTGDVGAGPVSLSLTSTSGFPGEETNFSIAPFSTCFGGVPAGATCTVSARFAPSAGAPLGLLHGTFSVVGPGNPQTELTGTATP